MCTTVPPLVGTGGGLGSFPRWAGLGSAVVDLYLDYLIESPSPGVEPTPAGAEHYFVNLFVAALPGLGAHGMGVSAVRERVRALGIAL